MQKINVKTVVMSNLQDEIDFNILMTVILCVNMHQLCFLIDITEVSILSQNVMRSNTYHYVTHLNIYRQSECLI